MPAGGDRAIEWDSNGVPDGTHQARLLVDDAAGNTLVHGPFQIHVANTPTSCAAGGGRHAGRRALPTRAAAG